MKKEIYYSLTLRKTIHWGIMECWKNGKTCLFHHSTIPFFHEWHNMSYLLLLLLFGSITAEAQTTNEIKVRVDGLSCPFCAYTLEKKFTEMEVIEKIHIDFDEGVLFLNLKEGEKISDELIKEKVDEAGFTVRKIIRQDSEKTKS